MMEVSGDKLELTVQEFDAMVHPEDLGSLRAAVDPANANLGTVQNEFRLMLPSGSLRWMRSQWRFELTDGAPTRATGAMIDITEEKKMLAQSQDARQAERLEQERKTILELVAKDQPLDKISTTMAHAVASHLPGSLCSIQIELTDASRISVYSGFPERLATALDRVAITSIRGTFSSQPIASLSTDWQWFQFIESCGDFPFQHYRAVPILHNMRMTGMILSFFAEERAASHVEEHMMESWGQFASLAVERRGLYEQLSFRAQYDPLTTLLNRASLYDRADAQIRNTSAERSAMAVLYLDVDDFKEINDRFGHGAGDKVLPNISQRILKSVRQTDFAARIGGDEFVVILPGVSDRREASRIAGLLTNAIEQPVPFNGRELRVGASVGTSIYPDDGAHTDALLKIADEDMYREKLRRRSFQTGKKGNGETALISRSSPALVGVVSH
jgi:diguanylate cyclase (GGDEF)-like protein